MNKKLLKKILLTLIFILILNVSIVYAEGETPNCDALLTNDAAEFIKDIVGFARIAVPILLVVLCSSDFITVIISQDDNATKKSFGRIVKRFIAAAAFFFVPTIIGIILGIPAIKDSLNLVDDPTCGIANDFEDTNDVEE